MQLKFWDESVVPVRVLSSPSTHLSPPLSLFCLVNINQILRGLKKQLPSTRIFVIMGNADSIYNWESMKALGVKYASSRSYAL